MAKKDKKNKRGGLAGLLGLDVKKAPTDDQKKTMARYESLKMAYAYLRDRIDSGCSEYFRLQNTETLQQHLGPELYQKMIKHLETLRAQGIAWAQPSRKEQTNSRLEVVNEQRSSKGKVEKFVIEERFIDRSLYRSVNGGDTVNPGKERVIQATIEVKGGDTNYRLLSVVEIKGATIEENL